ncbi:flavodoxin family protein [Bacillus marinisedimentorum]|uniref:flavodoxin family protein n=1 Tax=Bacillus marinisedimentorum TaxID=1821260 RepID=UPI00087233AF|nr:flavodoxin domain-containing protein [Bacillus marinisedimentorum]
MKKQAAAVVYDSAYGNTEAVARRIAMVLGTRFDTEVLLAGTFKTGNLSNFDFLVIGCPTQRHRPSPAMEKLVEELSTLSLKSRQTAVFDTRYDVPRWKSGSAAFRLSRRVKRFDLQPVVEPKSFFVAGRQGPLKPSQLKEAEEWTKVILSKLLY